jgi:hypothetical protein
MTRHQIVVQFHTALDWHDSIACGWAVRRPTGNATVVCSCEWTTTCASEDVAAVGDAHVKQCGIETL